MDYQEFLARKSQYGTGAGFEPLWMPDFLFPFQQFLVDWTIRQGRGLIAADCGLGKSPMALVWVENVRRKTGKPVLLATPLGVASQFEDEARKFGIDAKVSRTGKPAVADVTITNYEQLGKFNPDDFGGMVCDECFAAGTLVDTPRGQMDIVTLRAGDEIVNASGTDRISDVHRREVPYAVIVTIRGAEVLCSPNHPFFTQRGWIGAQYLRSTDVAVETVEAMRMVRQGFHAQEVTGSTQEVLQSVLFSEMAYVASGDQGQGAQSGSECEARRTPQGVSRERIAASAGRTGADSRSEPHAAARSEREGLPHIESHEPRTFRAWGEWPGLDRAAAEDAGCTWSELASGIRHITGPLGTWVSDVLQAGPGATRPKGWHRGGRDVTPRQEGSRSEEGCQAGYVRVDGVEILESGDSRLDRLRDANSKLYFYDLGATRHPSYSVAGVLVHNSSILKNFDGKTKAIITEFMRRMEYRLLDTATAAPNDYVELGTSSEALGYLGHIDMLNRFFTNKNKTSDTQGHWRGHKAPRAWEGQQWRFKGHAEDPFWRWVASWARACRKPSDLGFSDEGYELPELIYRRHVVAAREAREGTLFDIPAVGLQEERQENRRTLTERCETAAKLLIDADRATAWCHLNDEGNLLTKLIDGAVQVSGADSVEAKEEKLSAFSRGEIRVLVIKPKIGAWGLNWEHCHRSVYMVDHSFERMYQAIRRHWRFGQLNPVTVDLITTEGGLRALENIERKTAQADRMFASLTAHMRDAMAVQRDIDFPRELELPAWVK